MNGFAAEGFSKGLLTGLEASNALVDSSHKRKLQDAESEFLKRRSESASLKDEMEAQKLATETASKERLAYAPQAIAAGKAIMAGQDIDEAGFDALNKAGINLHGLMDDGSVDRMVDTFGNLRSGKLNPEDPLAIEPFKGVINPMIQRGIGGTSVDPATNKAIKTTGKEAVRLVKNPNDPSTFGVMVRVTGVDSEGKPHSYEELASQHGTSDPSDPYAFFSQKQLESKAASVVAMNEGLRRNPKNRELLNQYIRAAAIDPETQAKIDLRNAQSDTERSQQGAYNSLAGLRRANEEYVRTENPKTAAAERNKLEAQAGSYDRANTPQSRSLGSAKSTPKPKDFDESLASRQASRFIPSPRDQYDGKEKTTDEVMQKRNAHVSTIRDLMRVGGVDNQNDAARFAEQGQPIEMKTKDGRKFKGVRVVVDGKPVNIPTQWLN